MFAVVFLHFQIFKLRFLGFRQFGRSASRPHLGNAEDVASLARRDGCSSDNIILQPAANQAKWSSRRFMRGGVVIRDFLGLQHTDLN